MERKAVSRIMLTLLLGGMLSVLVGAFNVSMVEAAPSGSSEPPATEWNKTYGGASWDYAFSVVQTSEGGYAIAGATSSFGVGSLDFWLVKTDADGNMQWNKTYGGADGDMAYSVVQTGDLGYAMAGYTRSFGAGEHDVWLVKTDGSGSVQWNKTYGGTALEWARSVVQTSDGGYAIAGATHSFGVGGDFWLIKLEAPICVYVYTVPWKGINYTITITTPAGNITGFIFNQSLQQIGFSVSAPFSCTLNVSIPKELLDGAFKVNIDDTLTPCIITWNLTAHFIYFTVSLGTHNIKIIGEYGPIDCQINLTTLNTINLYLNEPLYNGTNIKATFYSYSNAYEDEVSIWSGNTPRHVLLSTNITHPLNKGIENATLVLTDDAGNILQIIATFLVHRPHLFGRIRQIISRWPLALSAERITLFKELVDISKQWPYAPP